MSRSCEGSRLGICSSRYGVWCDVWAHWPVKREEEEEEEGRRVTVQLRRRIQHHDLCHSTLTHTHTTSKSEVAMLNPTPQFYRVESKGVEFLAWFDCLSLIGVSSSKWEHCGVSDRMQQVLVYGSFFGPHNLMLLKMGTGDKRRSSPEHRLYFLTATLTPSPSHLHGCHVGPGSCHASYWHK